MISVYISIAALMIISAIIGYKIKPKYIYYSFLFYKKKISQDKNFFSHCIKFVASTFLATILYLFIEYTPFSDFFGKIIPLLPDYITTLLQSFKGKGALIATILALIELAILMLLVFICIKTHSSLKNKIVNELCIDKII